MNEMIKDFAKLNSQIVAELPDWKRQYDLRVSSYSPNLPEKAPTTAPEALVTVPPQQNR
jgi:hypothetical protein